MHHLSVHDLKGDQRRRWAEARRAVYRKILRDPAASAGRKKEAREKLAAARELEPRR